MRISVHADVRKVQAGLTDFQRLQLPFAASKAINAVAKKVQVAETSALPSVFDRPTPFTMNAFAMKRSTKTNLSATVYAKPIQAAYLEPSETGGVQIGAQPSGRAVLVPIDEAANAYGNLPKGALARLKGRKDVFIGTHGTKSGPVYGVWQRLAAKVVDAGGNKVKTRRRKGIGLKPDIAKGQRVQRDLKLLIAFDAPKQVKPALKFHERGEAIVRREFMPTLQRELAAAMRTAR